MDIKGISKNHYINELFVRLSTELVEVSKPYQTSVSLTFSIRHPDSYRDQTDRVFRDALNLLTTACIQVSTPAFRQASSYRLVI